MFWKKLKKAEPKTLLEQLQYKIERSDGTSNFHVYVRKGKVGNYIHITSFLKDLGIPDSEYELSFEDRSKYIAGCANTVKEAEKYLDKFCQLVVRYDNDEFEPENYLEEGKLKNFYVMNNL